MQDTEKKGSWVEQLEVTSPIKSIMGFVDELSSNYERRIAAMHADYQKDVEEIVACYKIEKQERQKLSEDHKNSIESLNKDRQNLAAEHDSIIITLNKEHQKLLQRHEKIIEELQVEIQTLENNYNLLNAEHKILLDSLDITKNELLRLLNEFKSEEELISLTKERIRLTNKQLTMELGSTRNIFTKFSDICINTGKFCQRIIRRRKTLEILIQPKREPRLIDNEDAQQEI